MKVNIGMRREQIEDHKVVRKIYQPQSLQLKLAGYRLETRFYRGKDFFACVQPAESVLI